MRRVVLVVPLATAAAAVAGARAAPRVAVAVAAGLLVGVAAAGAIVTVVDRRLARTTDALASAVSGGTVPSPPDRYDATRAERRLDAGVAAVVTALRSRDEALARQRARTERVLESLPTAVLLFGEAGLTYANAAARTLFGAGRDDARTPLQVLGVEGLAGAVDEARAGTATVDVEVERDDRRLVARASATGADGVALVVSDVTESRRLEAVRRDFVTNASHELKTPVAGIQALSDSLAVAVGRDPDRVAGMVGRLRAEAARLAQLVRELLDLARLEEDAAASTLRERVDVAAIVREQAQRLTAAADRRGVTVRVEADAGARVIADPGDLRLIAANLLENAVRYNRPGGVVHASVRRGGAEVVLEVTDDGIGIADADRDRVFERFYRVDKARSRAVGGTGLGLSIVRHAAERHGGAVTVRSVLGEGSTFRVVLPVEGLAADRR